MTQLIDKAAVVAEMKKRISLFKAEKSKEDASKVDKISLGARAAALEEILSFLDTLEVKEGDLEAEERMKECPFRQVGCTMYEGKVLECKGACSWVVDYPKLEELKAKHNDVSTWHLQKNEDIYDAVKDWSLHSFVCLMDDGTVQKFTGICSECYDGSINVHIDAINDEYGIENIVFWIETPNL